MDIPLGFISGIVGSILSYLKSKPKVAVEANIILEDAGGSGSADDSFWSFWKDLYIELCISNTGAPTTVKSVFISMQKNRHEVLRFCPYKTLQYINFKNLYKSPQLEKNLEGSRINTNDSWGPHIVVFTGVRDGTKEEIILSGCESFLIVEVVGQKLKSLPVKVLGFP